jgi:hypothetical protein
VLAQAEDRCHRIGQRNAVNILYLICQDPKLSVDSQLWGMLGRKTGMLGRVIDGEKNASMNVKVAEDGASPKSGGQSVQDELQSFFEQTSPYDSSSPNKTIPVNGTIMSFFQKQKDSAKKASMVSKKDDCIVTDAPEKSNSSSQSSIFSTKTQPKVEWACETCTFLNSRMRPKSGWLQCSMCGTNYFEDPRNSPTVTPPSTRKDSSVQATSSSNSTHARKSPGKKSTQNDPIVLDNDDDGVDGNTISPPKKLWNTNQPQTAKVKSNQEDPVVLDDDDDEIYKQLRRKRKTKLMISEVFVLDDRDFPTTDGVESNKCPPPSRLAFSVSKNSGRITIHYAGTNESSSTNFEIDQVLSEATADQLMEAKTNRKSTTKAGALPIEFNLQAINRGEYSKSHLSSCHLPSKSQPPLVL